MSDDSIHKLTLYKLNEKDIDAINIPGYKLVANGSWSEQGKDFPYRLFFYKDGPKEASWMSVFKPLQLKLDRKNTPATIISGFILIIQVGSSLYGITGGIGHISLRKYLPIEFRFGIDLAQRILALPELRGLSQKDTGGIVNVLSRGFRGIYNPQGDISNLKRVLTHIRGTLKKQNPFHEKIGCSIQASDALAVSGRKSFRDIITFIVEVDKLANHGVQKIAIPQLEHIDKKSHPKLLAELEACLIDNLRNYDSEETHSFFLDNEDIGYLPDRVMKYTLFYNRRKYEADEFESAFTQIRDILSNIDSENDRRSAFNRMHLRVYYDDGAWEERPLFYFLCGDVEYENDVYFLNNQKWYRASIEFIKAITNELDNIEYIDPTEIGLREWDKSKWGEEKHFNASHNDLIILDRNLVKIPEEKAGIEFCDLLNVSDGCIYIIHVKKAAGAALRALFAQGFVSAKLYAESDAFRKKIYEGDMINNATLTARGKKILDSLKRRQKREMKVVFAIFDDSKTHKVASEASTTSKVLKGTLSIFAKVDLLDRVTNMRAMGYDVAVSRIKPYP
jgi:uncharacterized protein (TIGR04141 family)